MPTFAELHTGLIEKKNKIAVLRHLSEYLEDTFITIADARSPKLLLNDDRLPVPTSKFEEISESMLKEIAQLEEEIGTIMSATLNSGDTK